MPSSHYPFLTHWKVEGKIDKVYNILTDVESYKRWWRAAEFKTKVVEQGELGGLNQVVDLSVKGWLGYTLHWRLRCVRAEKPHTFTLEATGDFAGRGVWKLKQNGRVVDITYDWQVRTENFFLKYFSSLLRPLFTANHDWLMKQGEEGLIEKLSERVSALSREKSKGFPQSSENTISYTFLTLGSGGLMKSARTGILECPKCMGELREIKIGEKKGEMLVVDQCFACQGIWFDAGELDRVRNMKLYFDSKKLEKEFSGEWREAVFDLKKSRCPHCKKDLLRVAGLRGTSVSGDFCGQCNGLWLDGGEVRFLLKGNPLPKVVQLIFCHLKDAIQKRPLSESIKQMTKTQDAARQRSQK